MTPKKRPNSGRIPDAPIGGALIGGDVVQLRRERRVSIPARLFDALTWAGPKVTHAYAELVRPGYVRVHPAARVAASIEERRETLEAEAAEDSTALERLAVLADRYRTTALYGDRRIRLSESITVFLGAEQQPTPTYLYVQVINDTLEILSLEERNRRIIDESDEFSAG